MLLDIEASVSDAILVYRIKGVTTVASMTDLADRIRQDSAEIGISAALLDCAGMTGALSIAALHRVGDYFGRTVPSVRLAAINFPPSWTANHFSEDVVSSKGGALRHFATRESARRWLQMQ